jgi:hypothetical protein
MKKDEIYKISVAAQDAVHAIATAAESAKQVIANAASEAEKVIHAKNIDGTTDHDLIIKLDTKMDIITRKVDDLSDNTVSHVEIIEKKMATFDEIFVTLKKGADDKEVRIRSLETWVWKAIGGLGVLVFALGVLEFIFKK